MHEVSAARESLAELRQQLEQELARATEQKQDVFETVGAAQAGTAAETPLASEVDQNLRKSAERFQKLCRDAKRKLMGDSRPG